MNVLIPCRSLCVSAALTLAAMSAVAADAPPATSPPAPDAIVAPANAAEIEIGRRLYMDGRLPDGKPLSGMRWDNVEVSGDKAACVLCHRPSGMGSVEGDIQVPPITGLALYGSGDKVVALMDPRSGKSFNIKHDPYSDASLARAMREGHRITGEQMHVMMPRYELPEPVMQALIAYLRQLSVEWSPGVTKDLIRFATVITPEVPDERRTLLKDMIQRTVKMKNGSTALASSRRGGRRHMASAAEFALGTERKWAIDFWELTGAPETWGKQLADLYRAKPVFALVSGLSNSTWEPVQEFCEKNRIPNWFPSVDLTPATESFYTLYFTRGVGLEAAILAQHLADLDKPRRVAQVFRDDAVGRGAAATLAKALKDAGIKAEDRILKGDSPEAMAAALKGLGKHDAVMFWLRPADVALLDKLTPPAADIYFSAQLSRGEITPFAPAWKERLKLVYPFELPEKRQANLAYFQGWLRMQRLPAVDEPFQDEVYFALNFLTDTATDLLDNVYRDYLLERAENMLSRRETGKAEEEVRTSTMVRYQPTYAAASTSAEVRANSAATVAMAGAAPTADRTATERAPTPSNLTKQQAASLPALQRAGQVIGKREGTTVYPRLALGPNQRYASKGGYIAHFDSNDNLVAETDWIVP